MDKCISGYMIKVRGYLGSMNFEHFVVSLEIRFIRFKNIKSYSIKLLYNGYQVSASGQIQFQVAGQSSKVI